MAGVAGWGERGGDGGGTHYIGPVDHRKETWSCPEMSNQGLWRVLLDSLKGYNGLMVEKGPWRKL